MNNDKISGKERFLLALEQYELGCCEKYAPYQGEITYSPRHINVWLA
jgi:hypothetical protein